MIKFYKYEGAGNDFIMINNLDGAIKLEPDYIARICDRHFGVGADGVILLEKSHKTDCFMNYYNSDGSLAEMCGNGARCTAKFFLEETGLNKEEINLETRAGIKNIKINQDGTYSVDMGVPSFESTDFPSESLKIEGYDFNFVSMGNPHAVTIVDDLGSINIKDIGPKVETNPLFQNKINVEFIEKISNDYYKVKVWERGCGETLACGTGACAVFSILNKNENFEKEITLEFPGGKLFLSQNEQGLNQSEGLVGRTSKNEVLGHVILRGSAMFVFEGQI